MGVTKDNLIVVTTALELSHLKAMMKVFGYLRTRPKGRILIDNKDPEIIQKATFSENQNWIEFYPDAQEDIPPDMPEARGNEAKLICFADSDHARNKVTRRSVTGILLMINSTPITWVSKRQTTVEMSTYGSEMVAARIAVDLIMTMRYKLRMLGIKLEKTSTLLGDNMAVVLNTTIPSSVLKKKHLACAYHRVREMVACGAIRYGHIATELNLADLFTKPLNGPLFFGLLAHILFRKPMSSKDTPI